MAPPPDRGGRPGDRPGVRPRAVRVLGTPRGGGRGHRARPDQGGGARLRPGRREGHQPAGGRRADPGRLGAGDGAGRDGGDPDQGRQDQEPVVHRLPHPHHPRHAADADRRARVRRPARAVRRPRRRGAADDLLRPRHRRRDPRRHRAPAEPGAGAARAHHRHLMAPAPAARTHHGGMTSRRHTTALLLAAALLAAAALAACSGGGTTTLCHSQAHPVSGGTYTIMNNEWHSSAAQCITTDGTASFSVANSSIANTTHGAPGGYPLIYRGCHWGVCTPDSGLPIRVSGIRSGTVITSWRTAQPGGSNHYNVAYDIWFNRTPTTNGQPDGAELM